METQAQNLVLERITNEVAKAPILAMGLSPRMLARNLYFLGYSHEAIADIIGENPATIRQWKTRDTWENLPAHQLAHEALLVRWFQLMAKPNWDSKDIRDLDLMGRQFEREAKIRKFESKDGHQGDLNPKINNRNAGPKKPPKVNFISAEHKEKLREQIRLMFFLYQQVWFNAGNNRNRAFLKSRQIGATFFLALESLDRALEIGNNQIFISASRAQANNFKIIICNFVEIHTGIKLRGDPMGISIEDCDFKPTFYFLGTNYMTAQGYSGDLIMDEFAWIRDFARVKKVVSAVATLKKFRRTYASTPSVTKHEAYSFWSGEEYNIGREKSQQVIINLDGDEIKKGHLFGDNIWRQIVTIEDAIKGGNNLIDIDEIKAENSIESFNNLYMCRWIDDSTSAFPFELLDNCRVDCLEVWKDYKPYQLNYKDLGKCIIACDPSRSDNGDPAAICVLLKPTKKYNKWRLLEKTKVKGISFEAIAAIIKRLVAKYDVDEIIIDKNGLGVAVYDLVCKFFPTTIGTLSPPYIKSQWVIKGQSVFRAKRFEFDLGEKEIATDFMGISPKLTKSQGQLTYESRRSSSGHGEYAWCILMALSTEPFDGDTQSKEALLIIG